MLSYNLFSLDRICVSETSARGIPEINFDAHRAKKSFIEATANWLVKTDITRFYPSIYTHSISWAAYGKERVKANIKRYDGSFADRLDQLLRACNRNQTVGIPIGPETSRIIAEIISSDIDQSFRLEKHGLQVSEVDRLQDDWFIGALSLEQAELALSKLVLTYREFGLEINGSKTSVELTSLVSEQQWLSELGSFLSHDKATPNGRRLSEFLSLGIRMQVLYPYSPVINYVIAVIENQKIARHDAGSVESFLLRAIVLSPLSISGIVRVLVNLHHDTKAIAVARVTSRLKQELTRHFKSGNTLEVIWLLYAIRGLSARINIDEYIEYIQNPTSSAISLILLDMSAKGLIGGALPIANWANFITLDKANTSGLWLLAYEGSDMAGFLILTTSHSPQFSNQCCSGTLPSMIHLGT